MTRLRGHKQEMNKHVCLCPLSLATKLNFNTVEPPSGKWQVAAYRGFIYSIILILGL